LTAPHLLPAASEVTFAVPLPSRLAILACLLTFLWVAGCSRSSPEAPNSDPNAKSAANPSQAGPANERKGAARRVAAEQNRDRLAAAEAVPVEVAPVVRGPISAFLSYNSALETEAIVDIYPQTAGQVDTLLVEEGSVVKAGDPLLKIDERELRVDVEESSINYQHQLQGFARIEDLHQRNLINPQEFENNRYQLDQARLRDERAKLRLSYATVRAPFDGVVASRETQVGARVGTGTKLFSLVKLDEIVARVFVPGRYLSVVATDQPAIVTSEFLPGRALQGWVKRLSPVIDPKSGTFRVTIGVRGERPSDLPPGLFVNVRILTDTRPDALLIPKRAVVYEGGERYVFTVADGKVTKQRLNAGYEDPETIEILSGLAPGTPVVVLGQAGLKDGAQVRVVAPASDLPVNPPVPPAPSAGGT
jgi:membrane fusion protein, multidrug efflux system